MPDLQQSPSKVCLNKYKLDINDDIFLNYNILNFSFYLKKRLAHITVGNIYRNLQKVTGLGIFLEKDFWTPQDPHLLSILYMDLISLTRL